MLEIRGVSKTFNPGTITEKKALTDINLTLNDGDFVTVIGGNGAGKSTLLNLIAGVHQCDTGSIVLDGVDITRKPEYKRARYLGRVFQDPMLGTAANMEIEENLAMALRSGKRRTLSWGIKNSERALYRDKLALLDLGLEDRMKSKVGLLSGGQRQALTLMMATINPPKLLLLDEHTAALDPAAADKILSITRDTVEKEHLTCLMITHNMQSSLRLGSRTIMMDAGRIVLDVAGEERAHMTVSDLLARFGQAADNDRMLLGTV